MSESFGAMASKLAGLAARSLGWRPAEFWAATPEELIVSLHEPGNDAAPVSRQDIDRMMECETNG